jgi:hypothetical protein
VARLTGEDLDNYHCIKQNEHVNKVFLDNFEYYMNIKEKNM